MNTTENNILIAEFMGFEMTHKINYVPSGLPNFMKNAEHLQTNNPENLPFNSDWNWLMEVVEKIEGLGYLVKIAGKIVIINNKSKYFTNDNKDFISFQSDEKQTKIEAFYNACVEFIKWYNEQEKENQN